VKLIEGAQMTNSFSKESAKRKLKELVTKFNMSTKGQFTEQDTITIFILPFLDQVLMAGVLFIT